MRYFLIFLLVLISGCCVPSEVREQIRAECAAMDGLAVKAEKGELTSEQLVDSLKDSRRFAHDMNYAVNGEDHPEDLNSAPEAVGGEGQ